ncbi:nuclear transport factor 2 family protein [Streptomyces violens]|uniref:nuclear transport factor 2 family protein n=1 Tax=Streptomyces violens TaxID=66377 RepID=UPI000AD843B4|nr:nuclear transport factor 2 family protein [Streptomyces violens]
MSPVPSKAEELVRSYYERVDADDVDGLLGLFSEEAVYRRPGYEAMNGRAELEAFYRGERVIRKGSHTVHTITEQLPRVAVSGSFSGELKDGRQVSVEFADFFTLESDGRFGRRETFFYAPLV